MKRLATIASVAAALLLLAACTQIAPSHIATLAPTGTSNAQGSATARLVETDLTVEGVYEDLSGPPNSAEVLDETDGTVVFALTTDDAANGSFAGSGTLTSGQVDNLNNGDLSIRIYTDAYPETTTVGELEGNLRAN